MSSSHQNAHRAFVALGSNLHEPQCQVLAAMSALDAVAGTRVVHRSSLYRTAPVGMKDQPDFVNAVVELETSLEPLPLLRELQRLEQASGRIRTLPNGPRTLDLDLLLFDERTLAEADLVVPHPRMHERAFVLVPLAEIDAAVTIPAHGTAAQALKRIDRGGVVALHGT